VARSSQGRSQAERAIVVVVRTAIDKFSKCASILARRWLNSKSYIIIVTAACSVSGSAVLCALAVEARASCELYSGFCPARLLGSSRGHCELPHGDFFSFYCWQGI
jgi:hypothetical protein